MNGVHDLGGMHGFGPVVREENEPVFHSDWEKRVFGMVLTAMGRRVCNVDEFRRAIERMPPPGYLAATYYEKWLYALEALLVEKGVATPEEIRSGHAAAPASATAAGTLDDGSGGVESFDSSAVKLRYDRSYKAGFKVGDRVVARNFNPQHHTRLPRYARGKRGVVRYDHGVFVFPDTHAHGQGGKPQHVYTVAFDARELWGADRNQRAPVYLDCWEDYLERDRAADKPAVSPVIKRSAASTRAKAVGSARASKPAPKPEAKSKTKSKTRPRAAASKGKRR